MSVIQETISAEIWDAKYRYRHAGKIIDSSIEDTWQRVAKAISHVEKPKEKKFWQQEFYHLLEGFKFLPGGRILAGAGTTHKVTLFNCFVMDIKNDSLAGIFSALKEGALTLQQGGGIGYDFSGLRPRGEYGITSGIVASGPVSFMRIWNTTCGILLSTGARRGAMMGVLRCDHPDIEEFITAKNNPAELRHFNVSVLISDAFMKAVKNDDEWPLTFSIHNISKIYKKVRARKLWESIIQSAYDSAEPGVLFEDTINRMNNLWYRETISATNPCGEIPLPAYGACNLGSLNLTQFVTQPFTSQAEVDWHGLENSAKIATRFLDNVIDVSRYPLKAQKEQAQGTRRIGLGFAGLADAFVMLGLQYGSDESMALASKIMKTISDVTWNTSSELAIERGSFPFFEKENYLQGRFVKSLSADIQKNISTRGMRNSHHNTIAPTGTISLLANNISSGLEPIFQGVYERNVIQANNEIKKYLVTDYALAEWRKINSSEKFPPAWVDSQKLTPQNHLQIQQAVQPYIDNAISKTINLPADFPFEKLHDVYTQAHEMGLKGCTIYRPNPITGSVLNVTEPEEIVEPCCQM
ncbi:MAG: adenosylcobalamin-dependent ribonucleoside-diphosphate reductase [Gammaproteobacteria bacterium]|nr:adenosylcobalamin-dependent ribonucleoside-diphosphate reductase [Gammaproteobacteria bacterium]